MTYRAVFLRVFVAGMAASALICPGQMVVARELAADILIVGGEVHDGTGGAPRTVAVATVVSVRDGDIDREIYLAKPAE